MGCLLPRGPAQADTLRAGTPGCSLQQGWEDDEAIVKDDWEPPLFARGSIAPLPPRPAKASVVCDGEADCEKDIPAGIETFNAGTSEHVAFQQDNRFKAELRHGSRAHEQC